MPSYGLVVSFLTVLLIGPFCFSLPVWAQEISSTYTKLDLENACEWQKPADEIEAQMGGRALCQGFGLYPVIFSEGDLRQFVFY